MKNFGVIKAAGPIESGKFGLTPPSEQILGSLSNKGEKDRRVEDGGVPEGSRRPSEPTEIRDVLKHLERFAGNRQIDECPGDITRRREHLFGFNGVHDQALSEPSLETGNVVIQANEKAHKMPHYNRDPVKDL